jgi:hypothetical protein
VNSQVRAVQIRPTYPLDEKEIVRLKRAAIMRSPRLIALYLAGLFAGSPTRENARKSWISHLADLWRDADEELSLQAVWELVHNSNQEQDQRISQMIHSLNVAGKRQYGISLGKFLLLKQRIEQELHIDPSPNPRKAKVETVVDSICQEVCHEIFRLSKLDDQLANVLTSSNVNDLSKHQDSLHHMHERIMKAYTLLSETAEQLAIYLTPGQKQPAARESDMFDQLLETLRREQHLAQTVDQRLRDELRE